MTSVFAVAVLALSSWAGMEWNWAQPAGTKYHAEALVSTPRGFRYIGGTNIDARGLQVGVQADLTCSGTPDGKAFSVVCKIDSARLDGRAFDGEQDKLDAILKEYSGLLTGSRVEMRVRPDGQVSTFDLEGIDTTITRTRIAEEQMRQLMRKTLAPLSIQMPKKGDASKPWKHKGMPLFYELMTMAGTTGGVVHKYQVDGEETDAGVFVVGQGHGNLGSQAASQGATTAGAYNMVGASQTRFDPKTGLVLYSEVAVTGEPNGMASNLKGGIRYALSAWVGQVREDGSFEGLEGVVSPKK